MMKELEPFQDLRWDDPRINNETRLELHGLREDLRDAVAEIVVALKPLPEMMPKEKPKFKPGDPVEFTEEGKERRVTDYLRTDLHIYSLNTDIPPKGYRYHLSNGHSYHEDFLKLCKPATKTAKERIEDLLRGNNAAVLIMPEVTRFESEIRTEEREWACEKIESFGKDGKPYKTAELIYAIRNEDHT